MKPDDAKKGGEAQDAGGKHAPSTDVDVEKISEEDLEVVAGGSGTIGGGRQLDWTRIRSPTTTTDDPSTPFRK